MSMSTTTLCIIVLSACLLTLVKSNCISDPTNSSCVDFEISDSTLESKNMMLCNMMYMPGCTIKSICGNESYAAMYPQYCTPFSIYKTICIDMPGMGPCADYKNMCMTANSVVKQCDKVVIDMMTTSELSSDIAGICGSMNMEGCDKCNAQGSNCDGDALEIYSDLCMMMDMTECADWKSMCADVGDWPVCSTATNPVPSMIMYFHSGINEYFLFKEFVPTEQWEYLLAVFVLFICSVLYELLKLARFNLEKKLVQNRAPMKHSHELEHSKPAWSWETALIRSIFHFIEVSVGSLLMLLLMTFNYGICASIVLGRTVGAFIVGNRMDYRGENKTAECH